MINVGILGAGGIAHVMADTINKMNEAGDHTAKLYAVASRDIIKSEIFANQNNVEKFYGSYEEMLEDPNVDLVYVATPHSHHYEHMKLVLEHDKNILCEKAFTVNAHQAREIFEIAEKKGLVVAEAIWTRYQPMREMINEQVFSGKIGQPKMLTANLAYDIDEVQRLYDPKLAGGALLDVGVYTLNFAEMIFGPADNIQANCITADKGVDLGVETLLEGIKEFFPGGKTFAPVLRMLTNDLLGKGKELTLADINARINDMFKKVKALNDQLRDSMQNITAIQSFDSFQFKTFNSQIQ